MCDGPNCGKNIYRTDRTNQFLSLIDRQPAALSSEVLHAIRRTPFSSEQISLASKHSTLADEIVAQYSGRCEEYHQRFAPPSWLYRMGSGEKTWTLGNGTFLTLSGDMGYKYSCPQRQVHVALNQTCGSYVEVEIPASAANLGKPGFYWKRRWFVEPVTRRLVSRNIPGQCWKSFPPPISGHRGTVVRPLHRANSDCSGERGGPRGDRGRGAGRAKTD